MHQCEEALKNGWLAEYDEYRASWRGGYDDYWQESGESGIHYCPWCGEQLK